MGYFQLAKIVAPLVFAAALLGTIAFYRWVRVPALQAQVATAKAQTVAEQAARAKVEANRDECVATVHEQNSQIDGLQQAAKTASAQAQASAVTVLQKAEVSRRRIMADKTSGPAAMNKWFKEAFQ